jgi:hypothetical protein
METLQQSTPEQKSYNQSWTAYIWPTIFFLIALNIGGSLFGKSKLVAIIIILFALALFSLKVISIRSIFLYIDKDGVWVQRGIFPWSKGIMGIKWRDIEDAIYFTGLKSWLFKSYTIRVGHRFTKTSEIILSHVARGDIAVMDINELHKKVISTGSIEGIA